MTRTRPRTAAQHKRGFSLLELVVAIVVLGILAALAIPTYSTYIANSKNATAAATLSSVASDAIALASQNGRSSPNSSDITTAMGEVPALSSAGAGLSASGTSLSWAASTSATVTASSTFGNVSVDLSTTGSTVGFAMKTAAVGCAMAEISNRSVTSWWYGGDLGLNCNGTQALSGQSQSAPSYGAAPTAPSGLTATGQNGAISLSWTASTVVCGSLSGYIVYQSLSPSGPFNSTAAFQPSGSDTTVNETGLTNGTTYYFEAIATTSCGNSALSNTASAFPSTVPGQPSGFSATPGIGTVSLSWSAPASTGGSAITGYTVTSSPSSAGCSTNASTLTCNISGLTNGQSYTYSLVANNAAGSSAPPVTTSATELNVPGAPTGVTTTFHNVSPSYSSNTATISWTAPASNGGSAITGYVVTQSPGGQTCSTGSSGTSCNITSGISNGYSSTWPGANGLVSGVTYSYTVKVTNAVGTTTSSAASLTTNSSQIWSAYGTTTCVLAVLYSTDGAYEDVSVNAFISNKAQVINSSTGRYYNLPTSGSLANNDQLCINAAGDAYVYNPNTSTKVLDLFTSYSGYCSLCGSRIEQGTDGYLAFYVENSAQTAWLRIAFFNGTIP